jgi:hypothetical protein
MMRLSDAGLRRLKTSAVYPDHRLPPWLTEDAARDRSNRLLCGADFDEFALRRRWRDGFARFAQGLDVEFNALANEFQYFSARLANRNAAGKVWNVRTIACLAFFNYH